MQVIDLEGLANHRGSLFGALPGGQPAQKLFESRLAMALSALDPARPVVVEAESSRIGDLILPRAVWKALCAAPRLRIEAPLAARAAYTAQAYADAVADAARDAVSSLGVRSVTARTGGEEFVIVVDGGTESLRRLAKLMHLMVSRCQAPAVPTAGLHQSVQGDAFAKCVMNKRTGPLSRQVVNGLPTARLACSRP